jgi:hypothetical protein
VTEKHEHLAPCTLQRGLTALNSWCERWNIKNNSFRRVLIMQGILMSLSKAGDMETPFARDSSQGLAHVRKEQFSIQSGRSSTILNFRFTKLILGQLWPGPGFWWPKIILKMTSKLPKNPEKWPKIWPKM